MREFEECFELAKKIKDINEDILELKSKVMSPKNQIISDMPKGKGGTNEIESYIIRLERLERIVTGLKLERALKWNTAGVIIDACGITDKETLDMLQLRFYHGYSWNRVAAYMKKKYPTKKWNVNKCFRVFRSVLDILHKKAV